MSPIPSGTWALNWVAGDIVTAAEMKKSMGAIYDSTAGIAVASFDITSIVATYAHLRIEYYLRGDTAAASTNVLLRCNNDASAIYQWQNVYGSGATAGAQEGLAVTSINCGNCPANTAGANMFGTGVVDIPHYAGATNMKGVETVTGYRTGGATGNGTTLHATGWWASGAAINRITILPGAGNFVAGSRVTVYALGA